MYISAEPRCLALLRSPTGDLSGIVYLRFPASESSTCDSGIRIDHLRYGHIGIDHYDSPPLNRLLAIQASESTTRDTGTLESTTTIPNL